MNSLQDIFLKISRVSRIYIKGIFNPELIEEIDEALRNTDEGVALHLEQNESFYENLTSTDKVNIVYNSSYTE